MIQSITFFTIALLSCSIDLVSAHGQLVEPQPRMTGDPTIFLASLPGTRWYPQYKAYDGHGDWDLNAVLLNQLMKKSSRFPSVRAMIDAEVQGCGNTDPNASPIPISTLSGSMKFQNTGRPHEGFIRSHAGPCEAYLDDKLIFRNDNCAKTYTSSPARMPVSYDACPKGKTCMLRFYWAATHHQAQNKIELYKNCVPLTQDKNVRSAPTPTPTPKEQASQHPEGNVVLKKMVAKFIDSARKYAQGKDEFSNLVSHFISAAKKYV